MPRMPFAWIRAGALAATVLVTLVSAPISHAAGSPSVAAARAEYVATTTASPCTTAICTYSLGVNPGLLAGKPFACPAIQNAVGTIKIVNRFATHQQLDTMTVN